MEEVLTHEPSHLALAMSSRRLATPRHGRERVHYRRPPRTPWDRHLLLGPNRLPDRTADDRDSFVNDPAKVEPRRVAQEALAEILVGNFGAKCRSEKAKARGTRAFTF